MLLSLEWLASCGVRIFGYLLSALACFLIAFVTYAYFDTVLPSMTGRAGSPYAELITSLGLWIVFNIYFNYVSCAWLGPGYAPPTEEVSDELITYLGKHDPGGARDRRRRRGKAVGQGKQLVRVRFCDDCNGIKPMRTHHCSVCRRCVLKMDHHCPWLNNCVGYRNHRFFILFLLYLNAGCIFFLLTSYKYVGFTVSLGGRVRKATVSRTYVFALLIAVAAGFATALFAGWTLLLLGTNQSTIEFYGNVCSVISGKDYVDSDDEGDETDSDSDDDSDYDDGHFDVESFEPHAAAGRRRKQPQDAVAEARNPEPMAAPMGEAQNGHAGDKPRKRGKRKRRRVRCGPFDLGFRRNVESVFGSINTAHTWLLPSWRDPPGNGLVFPLASNADFELQGVTVNKSRHA